MRPIALSNILKIIGVINVSGMPKGQLYCYLIIKAKNMLFYATKANIDFSQMQAHNCKNIITKNILWFAPISYAEYVNMTSVTQ